MWGFEESQRWFGILNKVAGTVGGDKRPRNSETGPALPRWTEQRQASNVVHIGNELKSRLEAWIPAWLPQQRKPPTTGEDRFIFIWQICDRPGGSFPTRHRRSRIWKSNIEERSAWNELNFERVPRGGIPKIKAGATEPRSLSRTAVNDRATKAISCNCLKAS